MEATEEVKRKSATDLEDDGRGLTDDFEKLLPSLPKERGWRTHHLYQHQGCWFHAKELQSTISAQKRFQAQDSDIIVASVPRSGTIWLKASVYAIVNRRCFPDFRKHPLLLSNPHDLVPFLEYKVYGNNQLPDLSGLPPPRLFATHVPFPLLPESIKNSNSRMVYICRNPLDNFISFWQMSVKLRPQDLGPLLLEEAFDMYCRGIIAFGPYWDHMLGYWRQSLDYPKKFLFMKYEEMKEDVITQLKRLADFFELPFSLEEEKGGVLEEISRLCSFQNLKEFRFNEKVGYFRKGEVGDWVNHLTPSMVGELSKITEEKLKGTGLAFKFKL